MKTSATRVALRSFHGGRCSNYQIPEIVNEDFLHYAPGSKERADVQASIKKMTSEEWNIPCVVNGEEIRDIEMEREIPHDNQKTFCKYHYASKDTLQKAVNTSLAAQKDWARMPFQHRAAIWLKAADLMATKYRADILASCMIGQSKTVWQAEIDAAVESIDFLRFDVKFAQEIYDIQPISVEGTWNFMDHRPLEGFCLSITPFNFTAIGIHLPTAAALMGNTVVWKCSDAAVHSNYLCLKIMEEAGLPPGVINFCPADPSLYNDWVIPRKELAGVGFTGSTATFGHIWQEVGKHIHSYNGWPRLVGECGGKNFHLVHESADMETVMAGTVRGTFEYQGQKCSATSRMYVPESMWPELKDRLVEETSKLKMGNVHEDLSTFMGAVIDEKAFRKIKSYIDWAKNDSESEIIVGGKCDDSQGWFVEPTIIQTSNPHSKTITEEIFGPVLTVFVYPNKDFKSMPALVDSSPYALTGSIFAKDRAVIDWVSEELIHSAGNFYVNDKSTGSIVGQQPFGGSRSSGTNDKAGSAAFMQRWCSPRSTKENFYPLRDISYPSMA
ncbi:Delta-1-pyrroline-5-carboxylate dehydrogenase [Diplonema papillatum]|nr:Delta-1-pyrroline-5-carboxylate dehydrogenase [Diplonema papillatum]KAJ9461260.1 Delta-1-pyrroline-5-carboxylate dehydrogenase [Diplonema papillatum]